MRDPSGCAGLCAGIVLTNFGCLGCEVAHKLHLLRNSAYVLGNARYLLHSLVPAVLDNERIHSELEEHGNQPPQRGHRIQFRVGGTSALCMGVEWVGYQWIC